MRAAKLPMPESDSNPGSLYQKQRLLSLDAFRGWTMFWIVGGKSLMTGLQALGHHPVITFLVGQLHHLPWQGLVYYDIIWPSFMLMTGLSLPFSYAKRILTQSHREILWRVLRRVTVLFLLGSLRESIHLNHPFLIELSSALQPIAIAYFFAFLMIRKSWRFQTAVGVSILLFYTILLAFVPAPGVSAGTYENGKNLVAFTDMAVLGRHHKDGWGTVLSTIPALATTILGLLIGQLMRSGRSQKYRISVMVIIGFSTLCLGWILHPVVPVIMKLWTTSYGLVSMGWSCLLFALFYWLIDVCGYRRWAFPFIVIGMNALAVYMGRSIVPLGKIVGIFTVGIAGFLGAGGALFQAAAVLAVEWLILYWMYRKRLFLTA